MSRENEQLADSLNSDEKLIETILFLFSESGEWDSKCNKVWENPSTNDLLDIASHLKSGEYCWGLSTLSIPDTGGVAYTLS